MLKLSNNEKVVDNCIIQVLASRVVLSMILETEIYCLIM